jgi:Putative adhesin
MVSRKSASKEIQMSKPPVPAGKVTGRRRPQRQSPKQPRISPYGWRETQEEVIAMTNGITARSTRRPHMKRGRRLTLILGVLPLLAFVGWAGLLSPRSFPVSYTFPSGSSQLTARLEGGTIALRQASAVSTPALTGTARYTLFRSSFTHSGGTVRYHCPWRLGTCSLDATLRVPASFALSLAAHGSDVNLPDFSQNITLNTGGGDLMAGTVRGDLNLSTGGGDIRADRIGGPSAKLATGGGDITVKALVTSGTAKVVSSGGDVTMTCPTAPVNLQVTSGGGDVTIVLPQGSYLFNTNAAGGDISQPASNRRATNEITVRSGGGDITISEAS